MRSAILDATGIHGIVNLFHSAITSPQIFMDIFSLGFVRNSTALSSPRITDSMAWCLPLIYGDLGLERRVGCLPQHGG